MIAIVDYQMGNLRSVQKAFEHGGFDAVVTDHRAVMMRADGVVLPGVGAFGDCYRELEARKLTEPLCEWIAADRPFLGICLGLQILMSSSEESPGVPGLGVIPGRVRRFSNGLLKVPHMGWNQVRMHARDIKKDAERTCPVFEGIPEATYFYFVHSYYVEPEDAAVVAATTDYGIPFVSAVWRGNVFATQFHPEKSQEAGLRLINNFGRLAMGDLKLAHTEVQNK